MRLSAGKSGFLCCEYNVLFLMQHDSSCKRRKMNIFNYLLVSLKSNLFAFLGIMIFSMAVHSLPF